MKLLILLLALTSCYAFQPIKPAFNKTASYKSRIIGGQPAIAGSNTFAAAIYAKSANFEHFCGGTLLRNQWVLTAAQCVYGATSFRIELGSHNLVDPNPYRVTLATSTFFIHPDFNPVSYDHDIAIIKFRAPVELNDYISTIAVIGGHSESVYAIGWGQTSDNDANNSNNLLTVPLTLVTKEECRLTYGNQVTDSMVCASGNFNEGTCIGDMGSPLVGNYLENENLPMLVGIASFISGNGCESTDPSGFTDVEAYENWIYGIINGQ